MSDTTTELPAGVWEQVSALFRDRAPVLVEVRFPRMGTSSDWYLLEEEEQFEQIRRKLGPGVELCLASAWDVELPRGSVQIHL